MTKKSSDFFLGCREILAAYCFLALFKIKQRIFDSLTGVVAY